MNDLVAAAVMALAVVTTPQSEPTPVAAPIVVFDIAGPDSATLKAFYASNFG